MRLYKFIGVAYSQPLSAGLEQLSQDTSILGFFLEAREDPQKNIFEGDSKTTNPVVAKCYEKQKITSSWFYHCHPYF
jgi:hypothetical protein